MAPTTEYIRFVNGPLAGQITAVPAGTRHFAVAQAENRDESIGELAARRPLTYDVIRRPWAARLGEVPDGIRVQRTAMVAPGAFDHGVARSMFESLERELWAGIMSATRGRSSYRITRYGYADAGAAGSEEPIGKDAIFAFARYGRTPRWLSVFTEGALIEFDV